jgi:thioredoxin 1
MAGLGVLEVSDATFDQEVLKSEQPVLVDFWAVWCGPCKAIAPIVDGVAATYAGKLKVAKVNVDENGATPSRYGIRGIPALLFFKGRQGGFDQIKSGLTNTPGPADVIEEKVKRTRWRPARRESCSEMLSSVSHRLHRQTRQRCAPAAAAGRWRGARPRRQHVDGAAPVMHPVQQPLLFEVGNVLVHGCQALQPHAARDLLK